MTNKSGLSRRRILTTGAGAAGALAASSFLPPSLQAALASPAPAGGLSSILHVIFLLQENRSFDHYFGTLRGVRGFGDRNAISQLDGRSVFQQPSGSNVVLPFPVREAAELVGRDLQYINALPHGWQDGQQARADGWHNGWIPAKGAATMTYYDRVDLPLHYELADTFTVCDAYHCSVLSSTSPNRNYHVSGHTGFEPGGKRRAIGNDAYAEDSHAGYSWKTYAELMEQAGVSWKVYQEWDNYQDNNLEFFVPFKALARKALQGDHQSMDSFYGALRSAGPAQREQMLARLAQGVALLTPAERSLFERALDRVPTGSLAASFRADVAAGSLPKVSYLVPSAADSEHPSASSPLHSANIIYQVLDALGSNPEVWQKTALFITYDENDGFFDHVPPPVAPSALADEYYNGDPIGLGIRVPMLVISPWTVGGYVCSETFDHSSTVRFLETWLGISTPAISPWRRTVAGDLTSAFDFSAGQPVPSQQRPAPTTPFTGRWLPTPPAVQELPRQEPGVRPARPLPYQPDAWARLDPSRRTLDITLANYGTASAHFQLFPYGVRKALPRHFDVKGRQTASHVFKGDSYRAVLTGPNGFRRDFAGSVSGLAARMNLSSAVDNSTRTLNLMLANGSEQALMVTLTPNAYGGQAQTVAVPVSGTVTVSWTTTEGWYDIQATVSGDPAFGRRLMGHIENGLPSISG